MDDVLDNWIARNPLGQLAQHKGYTLAMLEVGEVIDEMRQEGLPKGAQAALGDLLMRLMALGEANCLKAEALIDSRRVTLQ